MREHIESAEPTYRQNNKSKNRGKRFPFNLAFFSFLPILFLYLCLHMVSICAYIEIELELEIELKIELEIELNY